ncbi:MAG: glycosyltransferase family 2 protein [Candidatus Omnitrophica bacterium]|nr:glycosyltransferase family 2 protein [Candidatus Omnitrophota bacterium]MDD5488756.1 glycosyltransferase family 2 protein [Candidatus Omnitrophota bacterium]
MDQLILISVVIPCLNEEKGIGVCVDKARAALDVLGKPYEIVVCDNGSTDTSREIATARGAIVVQETRKGYGQAYLTGIKNSHGRFIVMADGDDTYDLSRISDLITPLENGYDLVMGSRFRGKILPGAMSWSHRYIGNPILSALLRLFFHTDISDSHCGYRAMTREAFEKMRLKTPGMEFASEMVVNAIKEDLKICEIPIVYSPRIGESKLESLRDAWRHVRFMLLYAPTYLYLLPGAIMMFSGLVLVTALSFGPVTVFGRTLYFHFNILGTVLSLLGFQVITLGIFSRCFSFLNGFDRFDKKIEGFIRNFRLEKGIILGLSLFITGLAIFLFILLEWIHVDFGGIDEIRRGLLATTLTVLGIQTVFSSFFLSFLIQEKN